MGVNGFKQLPLHVALSTNVVLLMILGWFFFLREITLFNCFNFLPRSYVVLFPRRLSPKLPVLILALTNSSTSKQKTDTEPGISYRNLLAY